MHLLYDVLYLFRSKIVNSKFYLDETPRFEGALTSNLVGYEKYSDHLLVPDFQVPRIPPRNTTEPGSGGFIVGIIPYALAVQKITQLFREFLSQSCICSFFVSLSSRATQEGNDSGEYNTVI